MSFIPVRLNTIRPWDVVNFDVFILVADHYVHYIKKTDPFDGDRIERLKTKGVKKLFITEEGEESYLVYLDQGLDQLQDKTIAVEKRAEVARDTMVTEAENAVRNVHTQEGYNRTQNRMKKMVESLMGDVSIFKNVLSSAGCSADVFQHSATVATLALPMANALGIKKTEQLVEIGLACLFHDIGHTKLDFNALVPHEQLTPEQLKKYKEHPTLGASMLADKPYLTKEMLELIADHEEVGDGGGFPNRKRISTLKLQSQIINLCNDYDRYSLVRQKKHQEISKDYFKDRIGCFELAHMQLLVSLLK